MLNVSIPPKIGRNALDRLAAHDREVRAHERDMARLRPAPTPPKRPSASAKPGTAPRAP